METLDMINAISFIVATFGTCLIIFALVDYISFGNDKYRLSDAIIDAIKTASLLIFFIIAIMFVFILINKTAHVVCGLLI